MGAVVVQDQQLFCEWLPVRVNITDLSLFVRMMDKVAPTYVISTTCMTSTRRTNTEELGRRYEATRREWIVRQFLRLAEPTHVSGTEMAPWVPTVTPLRLSPELKAAVQPRSSNRQCLLTKHERLVARVHDGGFQRR